MPVSASMGLRRTVQQFPRGCVGSGILVSCLPRPWHPTCHGAHMAPLGGRLVTNAPFRKHGKQKGCAALVPGPFCFSSIYTTRFDERKKRQGDDELALNSPVSGKTFSNGRTLIFCHARVSKCGGTDSGLSLGPQTRWISETWEKNDQRAETWPPLIVGNKYIYLRLSDNLPTFCAAWRHRSAVCSHCRFSIRPCWRVGIETTGRASTRALETLWDNLLHLIVFSVCIFDFTLFSSSSRRPFYTARWWTATYSDHGRTAVVAGAGRHRQWCFVQQRCRGTV